MGSFNGSVNGPLMGCVRAPGGIRVEGFVTGLFEFYGV